MFLFKSYNSLTFACQRLLRDDDFFFFLLLTLFDIFLTQIIASEGEGRKPSSDRDKYVAESEFALLGILSNNVNKYLSI